MYKLIDNTLSMLMMLMQNQQIPSQARVLGANVILARLFLVPVENASNKRRDQRDASLRARSSLKSSYEKIQSTL